MATVYKVRQGEQVLDVEGFAALVQMAQEGRLAPDDAVFVPASNRWHYARSIRQLREFFPAVEDPPPPPGKIREMPRENPREPSEQTNPPNDPTESTNVQEGNGGDVVRLRRGRWTADGKSGVEVPVFNYEMDLDPPPATRPLRLLVIIAGSLVIGGSFYLYKVGYAQFIQQSATSTFETVVTPPPAAPTPTRRAIVERQDPGERPTAVAGVGTTPVPAASRAPTPAPLPAFDAPGARSKVMSAPLTAVARADQLGNAIRGDLVKLAVPVRSVQLVTGKSKSKGPVPFDIVVDYSLGDEAGNHAVHARHYWMILAMTGRRATETRLNLRSVTVRSFHGTKLSSSAMVTADIAKGVAAGSQSPDAVLGGFAELTKH